MTDVKIPVNPQLPTKETDPTLGIASHIGAVAAGAVAGFASTYMSETLSAETQTQIALAVTALVTTVVHWILAKMNQVGKV